MKYRPSTQASSFKTKPGNIINDDSSTKPYQTLLGSAVRQLEMLDTELLLDLKFATAFFFAYSHL